MDSCQGGDFGCKKEKLDPLFTFLIWSVFFFTTVSMLFKDGLQGVQIGYNHKHLSVSPIVTTS